jgi:hypothetical protein
MKTYCIPKEIFSYIDINGKPCESVIGKGLLIGRDVDESFAKKYAAKVKTVTKKEDTIKKEDK